MRKKTFIILSSVVFTVILLSVLYYRGILIMSDTSGFYTMKGQGALEKVITFLPEFSIVFAILAIYVKKSPGLMLTFLSALLALLSFIGELFIKVVKLTDVVYKSNPPIGIVPWLNWPVIIICIILFVIKFRIFTIPDKIKIKI